MTGTTTHGVTATIRRALAGSFLLMLTAMGHAQSSTSHDDRGVRPNDGGEPEEITVVLAVLDIIEIEDRAQVFLADIYLEVGWRDPRLALNDDRAAGLRTFAVGEIWTPGLTILNDRGLKNLLPERATVDRLGNVTARQRLAGSLSVDLDLHDFPFDTQQLPVQLASYRYSPSEVVFSRESRMTANADELSGDGWAYAETQPEHSVFRLSDGAGGRSLLTFKVVAERSAAYYALTMLLPMTLILCLAWTVHWLPVDLIPARMGTASATVFSLIAFGISLRLTLPKIAYLTVADLFVLFSTLLVLGSLAVTVLSARWVGAAREDAALRLARWTRLLFPFAYLVVGLLTVMA
ncbi:MAG: hypothetical protein AB7I04_07570 [Pseudomonadales bacterium]